LVGFALGHMDSYRGALAVYDDVSKAQLIDFREAERAVESDDTSPISPPSLKVGVFTRKSGKEVVDKTRCGITGNSNKGH